MPARVLIVDDSGFIRRRLGEILSGDDHIEVIGMAVNGADGVAKAAELKPDVITMDIEMPEMDGITAVRRIMASNPTPILMLSTLTTAGAQATLDALEAGAMDFLPKNMEDIADEKNEAIRILRARVRLLAARGLVKKAPPVAGASTGAAAQTAAARQVPAAKPAYRKGQFDIVLIGASTGGPVALQQVLKPLPADFPLPILLVQHMPGTFTPAFAQRLDNQCAISVREARDGDALTPSTALLAPGGKQMVLESRGGRTVVRIRESDPAQHYRPCVDLTFQSVARVYPGSTLAIILTGMGADGRDGSRELKNGGSVIWAQDAASCVVYGMPAAVAEAGLADQVLPLGEIGSYLKQSV